MKEALKTVLLTGVAVAVGIGLYFAAIEIVAYMKAKGSAADDAAAGGSATPIENAPQSKASMKAVA